MIKTLELPACSETQKMALERVNYFPRQLLTVDEMVTESEYFRQKLRRHNLFLHGCGIVCGLEVTDAKMADSPSTVQITEGYALGPQGDEIYVPEPVFLDLARCGSDQATDPCEPSKPLSGSGIGKTVYVVIKYAECFAKPVRAMPAGCACDEEDCQYSRVRDSFQISCLTDPPPVPQPASLCDAIAQKSVSCPPCEINPWILLARVNLPSATEEAMHIDPSMRPVLASTATLQKRLIECCCGESADLEITKEVDPTNVGSGLFRFTIAVTNHGPSTAKKVKVTDSFRVPAGAGVTKIDPSDARWKQVQNDPLTYLAMIDELKNHETTTLSLTVSGSPELTNVAVVTSDTLDPNTNNNRASYPKNVLNPF